MSLGLRRQLKTVLPSVGINMIIDKQPYYDNSDMLFSELDIASLFLLNQRHISNANIAYFFGGVPDI